MKKARSSALLMAILIALGLASCGGSPKQSKAITDFAKRHEGLLKGFFFYPSTVRMLGNVLSEGNGELLSGIEQARAYVLWDDETNPDAMNFGRVKTEILAEGFELLMSMKSEGVMVDAYQLEGTPSIFVLFVNDPDVPFIIEMTGQLSMSAIQSVATMDFDKANDLLNLFPEKEVESIEQLEETPNATE